MPLRGDCKVLATGRWLRRRPKNVFTLVECLSSPLKICHLPFAICHLPFAICHLPFVICHLSFVICHLSLRFEI